MKKITRSLLLGAGLILSLAGCQKGNEQGGNGQDVDNMAVRFSAVTASADTRTQYSNVVTDNKERINWVSGDKVLLWSDKATVREGGVDPTFGKKNIAEYTISTIDNSQEPKSIAKVDDPAGLGLQYVDKSAHQLWGVYPAAAVKADPTAANSVALGISAEQTLATNSVTNELDPAMTEAYLLGYVGDAAPDKSVEMVFKPAYTAFEFDIKCDAACDTETEKYSLTITGFELTSESTAVAGDFTATCTKGTWTCTVPETTTGKSVKVDFPEGTTVTSEKNLVFTVFALPQDITDLKITFYTNEGTKSVKLKDYTQTSQPYLTFAAKKKHLINGLILPTGWYFSYITLDLQVLKWQATTITGTSAEFPQSTQFAVDGDGVKNGDSDLHLGGTGDSRQKDPYRQQWYFMPGQTVTVFFKVMLPAGGTWEVEPVGGTEENPVAADAALFTIKNVSENRYDGTAETDLYGPIATSGSTPVTLEITYNGTDTNPHSFYFHTYVYSGANKTGTKFNIDSETQIYDRGRGYHTFFVNSEHYPTE